MDPRDLARFEAIFHNLGLVSHVGGHRNGQRLDAADTAFLARQIEHVRARVYDKRYPALMARSFLPMATDLPSWASHVVQVVYDDVGRAKVVANGADDVPRVDIKAAESQFKVVSLGASYGFDVMTLRQALATGVPLSDKKGSTMRRVIETGIDEVLATGTLASAGQDLSGTFNGLITSTSVVDLLSPDAGYWDDVDTTADAILADLNRGLQRPGQVTNGIFPANTVLLSQTKYDVIAKKRVSQNSDTTVLEFFLKTNPGVQVIKWYRLDAAGTGGDDRAVFFRRDAECVEGAVPLDFEQLPPQVKNFETTIIGHARVAGVLWHQPKSACYMDLPNGNAP